MLGQPCTGRALPQDPDGCERSRAHNAEPALGHETSHRLTSGWHRCPVRDRSSSIASTRSLKPTHGPTPAKVRAFLAWVLELLARSLRRCLSSGIGRDSHSPMGTSPAGAGAASLGRSADATLSKHSAWPAVQCHTTRRATFRGGFAHTAAPLEWPATHPWMCWPTCPYQGRHHRRHALKQSRKHARTL